MKIKWRKTFRFSPESLKFSTSTACYLPQAGFTRKSSSNYQTVPQMPPGPFPKRFPKIGQQRFEELLQLKRDHLNRSIQPYYRNPIMVSSANMQWVFDQNHRRYLDFFAGIVTVSVGHCHPRLVKVAKDQVETLWHTTSIYTQPQIVTYAQKLTSKFPDPLNVAYFLNSGAEAIDMAMLLARLHTGNNEILALRNGYHGRSWGAMGVSAVPKWNFNTPHRHGVTHLGMQVDPYRGHYGGAHCRDSISQVMGRPCNCAAGTCNASQKYIEELQETIDFMTSGNVAALIHEGILGVGGVVQYPKGFIKHAYEIIRKQGGVCIADEVQTGFGRLGSHFWAFESHDSMPDIVIMGKGIGNGFPLAALVTTPAIAANLSKALYFNTYGGNPIASAVGEEVLNIIEDEQMQNNSHQLGEVLIRGLCQLRDEFESVGDVRGKGLMVGVEMVEEKETKRPLNQNKFLKLFEEMKDLGLLVGKGGPHGTVFRLKPPMCINAQDVAFALDVFRHVLKKNQ
ncbi:alanine--glyoxylate aminotransferase 2, mitochondrial-like [Convolutriloba macropyga]|uniref:alanine--glyoxylate aminotransferase 2, mitochondrial-like n=1 Tax=Convolutriloba macropyga TaxID=536237 RepID=UPI003F51FA57